MICRLAMLLSAMTVAAVVLLGAARAEKIGIVLLHGKQGTPEGNLTRLTARLEGAGFLLERPTLCWSRDRIYDKPFPQCLAEIDAAIAKLRGRGAEAIVVAGQSLGGVAALAYGARHDGLAGVVAIVPGPPPSVARRPEIARELDRAKSLIAAGKGDERIRFADVNQGAIAVAATPPIYVSFLDPEAETNILANTAKLHAPLLWLAADQDNSPLTRETGFGRAPPSPLNRYVLLHAGHFNAPDAAAGPMLDWLATLGQAVR